jgi:hypothetical protein
VLLAFFAPTRLVFILHEEDLQIALIGVFREKDFMV